MTKDVLNTCGEQEALVGYLYDELEPGERARFEAHLGSCVECQAALDEMRGVRAQLATWTLPEGAGAGSAGRRTGAHVSRRPWWAPGALAAAAVILLAVGAAIANLEITYGREGVSVRTGWSRHPATQATATALPSTPAGAPAVTAQPQAISAGDLAALEKRLRTEFQALSATHSDRVRLSSAKGASAQAVSGDQLLRRVQDLIEQSETRQRRELALRVAQVVRDFDAQRQTDLVRIQQGLGQIEGTTAADRQLLNYLVRASQRQDR